MAAERTLAEVLDTNGRELLAAAFALQREVDISTFNVPSPSDLDLPLEQAMLDPLGAQRNVHAAVAALREAARNGATRETGR